MLATPELARTPSSRSWSARLSVFAGTRELDALEPGDLRGFAAHVDERRPAIVRGLAKDWPAIRSWTAASLRETHGEARVAAYRVEAGHLVFDGRTGLVEEPVRLGDFLADVEAGRPVRHRIRERAQFAPMRPDVRPLAHLRGRLRVEENLWISAANTVSRLHFDQPDGLLVHVIGTKRVALFAASDGRDLYPYPLWNANAQFSRVDLSDPDPRRFPRIKRVTAMIGRIEPGDAVYLPGGAWHYVESDEFTVSLTYRWWRLRDLPRLLLADAYKALRGHAR